MKRLMAALVVSATAAGCGRQLDVGSDLLWTALFEGNSFEEWTRVGGGPEAFPSTNTVVVSDERHHNGQYAAKLTIDATGGGQQTAGLVRSDGLPVEAYYSAWYWLPRSVTVGMYWVIFKLRMRTSDDPGSAQELFDLNLANLPSGEMTLRVFDHRNGGGDLPLDVASPVVPVGEWFQIEAFYRNANDATGRLTFWLDGLPVLDHSGPMAPTPWVGWDATSIAIDLAPATSIIHVDDCAVSRSRVGPDGRLF